MKKIFTFLFCVMFVSALSAQNDITAAVQEADEVPVIGGELDAAWGQAEPHNIELVYQGATGPETPTLGDVGDTYWKALYTPEGIYILVYVADDVYVPYYDRIRQDSTGNAHNFDNVEVFLDCNYDKKDGEGGHTTPNKGHYQLAPAHNTAVSENEDWDDGTKLHNDVIGYDYAVNAVDSLPAYFYEYFLPWTNIRDKDGELAALQEGLGFEIAIADNDDGTYEGRERLVWSNNLNGDKDSWANMDDCGLITFDGYQVIYPAEITLSADDITKDNQALTIGVEIISTDPPKPPTDQSLNWVINEEASTARFLFDEKTGTITPLTDGTVVIKAWGAYEIVESNELTINITNQHTTIQEVSYIVDGYNDDPQEDTRPNAAWVKSGDGYEEHSVWVQDGVFQMSSDSLLDNPWSLKVRQEIDKERLLAKKDSLFIAKWKMWAEQDTSFQLVLEQRSGWATWGDSSATTTPDVVTPTAGQTRFDIRATTEPTWYEISFIPNGLLEDQTYDFGFQMGKSGGVIVFMDSLYLIEAADTAIIEWDYVPDTTSIHNNKLSETTLKVYPNPASSELNVSLSGVEARTKVAIYNSVGIKMEEIEVFGNHHVFDVSNYSSGIYIVRAKDQFVKFVR